jgi:L-rhamnose isomerase
MTRKYTFRKNQDISFESGSLMHEDEKTRKKAARNFEELSK